MRGKYLGFSLAETLLKSYETLLTYLKPKFLSSCVISLPSPYPFLSDIHCLFSDIIDELYLFDKADKL